VVFRPSRAMGIRAGGKCSSAWMSSPRCSRRWSNLNATNTAIAVNQSNGCLSTMVSIRSGPVEMIAIGAPTSTSNPRRYSCAFFGNSSNDLMPKVLWLQPANSS